MVKFHTIGQIEHGEYPFENAVVDVDVLNGTFIFRDFESFMGGRNFGEVIY